MEVTEWAVVLESITARLTSIDVRPFVVLPADSPRGYKFVGGVPDVTYLAKP
jgi:hypothetical protein